MTDWPFLHSDVKFEWYNRWYEGGLTARCSNGILVVKNTWPLIQCCNPLLNKLNKSITHTVQTYISLSHLLSWSSNSPSMGFPLPCSYTTSPSKVTKYLSLPHIYSTFWYCTVDCLHMGLIYFKAQKCFSDIGVYETAHIAFGRFDMTRSGQFRWRGWAGKATGIIILYHLTKYRLLLQARSHSFAMIKGYEQTHHVRQKEACLTQRISV